MRKSTRWIRQHPDLQVEVDAQADEPEAQDRFDRALRSAVGQVARSSEPVGQGGPEEGERRGRHQRGAVPRHVQRPVDRGDEPVEGQAERQLQQDVDESGAVAADRHEARLPVSVDALLVAGRDVPCPVAAVPQPGGVVLQADAELVRRLRRHRQAVGPRRGDAAQHAADPDRADALVRQPRVRVPADPRAQQDAASEQRSDLVAAQSRREEVGDVSDAVVRREHGARLRRRSRPVGLDHGGNTALVGPLGPREQQDPGWGGADPGGHSSRIRPDLRHAVDRVPGCGVSADRA